MSDAITELVLRSRDHHELRAFHRFHQKHPEVLDFIVGEIRLLVMRGHTAFSFASLWHYCRWKLEMKTARNEGATYLMNDHAAPYYARAVIILHPELNGLAEFRESTPDAIFGTRIEPLTKEHKGHARRRRLQWADGTPIEEGWRPTTPHIVTAPTNRKPDVHKEK